MIIFLVFITWLLGASASSAAILAICERKPDTFGLFMSEGSIAFVVIMFWPLFWPCYVVFNLTDAFLARFLMSKPEK